LWGFEEAKPACCPGLAFGAVAHRVGGSVLLVQCVRREEKTALRVDACPMVRARRREGPGTMGDNRVRRWPRPWAPPRAVGGRGADGTVVEHRGLPACRKTGERLLGLGFTGKRGPAQPLAGSAFLVTLLAPLRLDGALSLRLARLGIQESPTLGDTARGRGHHAEARALPPGGHGLRIGVGEDGVGLPQRGRAPGEPRQRGLGELLEVVGALEGTVGHQRRRARGGVELGHVVLDALTER
jgi:hypothetical protein